MNAHTMQAKNHCLGVVLAACTLALAACGGGGGSPGATGGGVQPPTPALVNAALAMQGFWSGNLGTAPDGATRSEAVVMPDGTAWILFETDTAVTALAKLALSGTAVNATEATVTASGNWYRLGTSTGTLANGTRAGASASGTASTNGTFTGALTLGGNAATNFTWDAIAGFTTPSVAADVVGTWSGTGGNGAAAVTWTVDAVGTLAGSSSAGCTYAGTLRPDTGTAVYDLAVAEDCGGTVRSLSGIATLRSTRAATATANSALLVVFTADAGASGGLVTLAKQ